MRIGSLLRGFCYSIIVFGVLGCALFGGSAQEGAGPEPGTSGGATATAAENTASAGTNTTNKAPGDEAPDGMAYVPDGTFVMGLSAEDPLDLQNAGRKRVTTSAFLIDSTEVTNAEYRAYLRGLDPEARQARRPDSTAWQEARSAESFSVYFRGERFAEHPVVAVTWAEARAYCQAQGGRLPTEAEWERAARAGHLGRVYPWEGLDPRTESGDYRANYKPAGGYAFDGHAFTAPVGAFPANDVGLHDMAGNVAEWTRDAWAPTYGATGDFNPAYQEEGEARRVLRGGAWNSGAFFIGVGVRQARRRDSASAAVGVRCAREVARLEGQPAAETTEPSGTESDTGNGEDGSSP